MIGWTRLRPRAEVPGQGNCPRTTDHHEGSGPVSAGRWRKGRWGCWCHGGRGGALQGVCWGRGGST